MGLRIKEREDKVRREEKQRLYAITLSRLGSFKGQTIPEVNEDFFVKLADIREDIDTESATALASRLQEDITRENRRSMGVLGDIKPNLVLDLL